MRFDIANMASSDDDSLETVRNPRNLQYGVLHDVEME